MFTWIWDKFTDLVSYVWDNVAMPVLLWIKTFFVTILAAVIAVISFITEAVQFLCDLITTLIVSIGSLLGIASTAPVWGATSGILAQANAFVPVSEFFALVTVTLSLWALCLTIRFFKWVREVVLP